MRRLSVLSGLFFCLLFSGNVLAQDDAIVRRAAFDIGSAAIKCSIADVDITTGNIIKTVERLSQKVDFAEDLSRSYDGNFSIEIMNKGIEVIEEMKRVAVDLKAVEFSGAGGNAFRTARNGRAYFVRIKEETGIPCRIISEQQAALLSYHAVRQGIDASTDLLVWDIGGSTMQMTARNLEGGLTFYIDSMASIPFKSVVIGVIQKKDINTVTSPNPISEDEVRHALDYVQAYAEMNIPRPLVARIRGSKMRVAGIGGVHYYAIPEMLGGRNKSYTYDELEKALLNWTGKPDEAFNSEYAHSRLTNLILTLGYMKTLGLKEIFPFKINEADGLLAAPEFW